ncbi:MAG: hypothetical protein H5T24_12680, partial [Bacteroidales bacterium]|nr:hypothetical protein [Bacteroidales bacterium]
RIDCRIQVTGGTINATNITMSGNANQNYILFEGTGTLNVSGAISGGGITSTVGGGGLPTSGTVNFNSTGNQNIGSYTYYNLSVSGGGVKSLSNNTTVQNILTLNSTILSLGNYFLALSSTASTSIQGGPFNTTCMIVTDGTGYVQQAVAAATSYTIPIGSNGVYAPVTASSITGSTYLRFSTVYSATLGSQYLKRYWQVTGSGATTATLTFQYDVTENPVDPSSIWVRPTAGAWTTPSGTQSFNDVAKTFTITGTTNITAVTSEWTAGYPPKTFFSYQSGNWDDPATWTSDPGGTTWNNIGTPTTDGDIVVILSGRTVTLTADVATTNLELNINGGGILDMSTFRFTNTLNKFDGQGTLKLASVN